MTINLLTLRDYNTLVNDTKIFIYRKFKIIYHNQKDKYIINYIPTWNFAVYRKTKRKFYI